MSSRTKGQGTNHASFHTGDSPQQQRSSKNANLIASEIGYATSRKVPPMIVLHLLSLYGLLVAVLGRDPLFIPDLIVHWSVYTWLCASYVLSVLGVTVGYHRHFSHRSFEAHIVLKIALLFLGAISLQGSALRWAWRHRIHHRYSDTDADPHNRRRGFWYCHIKYIFDPHPEFLSAIQHEWVEDLVTDRLVMLEHRLTPLLGVTGAFLLPMVVVKMGYGGSAWHAFLIAGCLRVVAQLHATWAVNSLTHAGPEEITPENKDSKKPYGSSCLAVQNFLVSVVSLGEGWHDWHHKYAWDYAAAEKAWWVQFNVSYFVIDVLWVLGLVQRPKRAFKLWQKEMHARE